MRVSTRIPQTLQPDSIPHAPQQPGIAGPRFGLEIKPKTSEPKQRTLDLLGSLLITPITFAIAFKIMKPTQIIAALLKGGGRGFRRAVEDAYLYNPGTEPVDRSAIVSDSLRQKVEDVFMSTEDGRMIHGWFVKPEGNHSVVVSAHGQSNNIASLGRQNLMEAFTKRGYGFLAFDYGGYGKSIGHPSEERIYKDMHAAVSYVSEHKGYDYDRQILLGSSLGGGPVAEIATRIPFQAVILNATYTSLPAMTAMVKEQMGLPGIVPLHRVVKQQFNNLAKVPRITSPLLIIHGEKDTTIPVSMGQTLYDNATTPDKDIFIIPDADHLEEAFIPHMDLVLSKLDAIIQSRSARHPKVTGPSPDSKG